MSEKVADRKHRASNIRWRVAATFCLLSLCVLSTVRVASGAFEAASIPVADISAQNGMVTGTLRMMGNRFLLYNGTRLESMTQSMEVNFERGGSMVLCPRSQLQILAANENTGMMLAFQSGGAEQPFPIRMGDEVITPDWRVALTSDARKDDMGIVQIVTNRHGDLCLQGNSQPGAYFRVSPLIGDESFHVDSSQSERFSDGKMERSLNACGCDANFVKPTDGPVNAASTASASGKNAAPSASMMARTNMPTVAANFSSSPGAAIAQAAVEAGANKSAEPDSSPIRRHKRPQDVAGYVRSFVRVVFGR